MEITIHGKTFTVEDMGSYYALTDAAGRFFAAFPFVEGDRISQTKFHVLNSRGQNARGYTDIVLIATDGVLAVRGAE